MKAIYYQRGETLDYFPTENVKNGAVVDLGTRIGVAAAPILAGEQGAVHVVGVFAMAKANGEAITQGAAVYYDAEADAITTTAEATITVEGEGEEEDTTTTVKNTPAGYAAASAAATDATVLVKLLG